MKTCGTCKNWSQNPGDKMTPLGYGCCPRLPVGQYLMPASKCKLPNSYRGKL